MRDNCIYTLKKLLDLLNVQYTNQFISDSILSHPDHPSLLAIADTLDKYRIQSLAVKIDPDKLKELPFPCIVQISDRGESLFYILNSISSKEVYYYDDKGKLIKSSKEAFLEIWTGVCLPSEKSSESGEIDIEKKLTARRMETSLKVAIAVLFVGWASVSFLNSGMTGGFFVLLYMTIKLVGLTVAGFLLWWEVDQFNPVLQSFCSGGTKINCSSVLDSKYAKILGGSLSLSLLGFSYFFGTFAYLLINGFSGSSLALLGYFSFAAFPVVLGSIYYQAFVIKEWCRFCIIIQAVLLSEIIIAIFGEFYMTNVVAENLFLFFALLLIPILGWRLIKPLIEKEKETNLYKRSLKKIKNNPDVLRGLLTKSKRIITSTEGLGIQLNKETAKFHVIKVCNPYCGPCAKAHPILENLVNDGKINLQILFTASTAVDDSTAKPVKHFLAIDAKGDPKVTQAALDSWYNAEYKEYDSFANRYPMNGELQQQQDKIEDMRTWCDAENITHTPTIFINGHELPKEYSVEDLQEVLG